ncbi:protein ENHANCED PSEUDOMONAS SUSCEPTIBILITY 1 [Ziziphus jujuba]|uniref:Protein ENHANCED PSEUDOMONAS SUSCEPTIBILITY 1 n=2 Tax=Ziziphus jujuba TaxID=326968 RepID=A0A6P4AUT0_ZIZJJ|nr:protein ENHANCED PSEUDOMONAS SUSCEPTIBILITY 1 [Ziziphus jujuba]KAH7520203.1 hypothetical protein FEM48_Zijuj08G0119300 [Ziziphus jujuba var. spinosa]
MTLKNIRIISTATILPRNHHQNEFAQRMELTPWDLQLLLVNPTQRGLLFHKPNNSGFIQHLEATLSKTLDIFYPLAGRLSLIQNDDNTSSFFLHCNGEGVDFVHAVVDDGITVTDILNPLNVPHHILHSLFPLNGILNLHGISKPLLAVQVTELEDGIFIACTMNHSVADGTSFWNFFNTWSQISRAGVDDDDDDVVFKQFEVSQVTPPLVFDRQFLEGVVELPVRIPFSNDQIRTLMVMRSTDQPALEHRMFHFSKERIAELKAKANAEMGSDKISSLQALLGHLWVSVTRNRNLNADQEVVYMIMLGLRNRIEPKLPEQYLGNCATAGVVKTTAGELLKKGSGWAASQINKMIASQTSAEAKKRLEGWAKNPILVSAGQVIETVKVVFTGSSHRFDVYGNDFGWGRPIAVRTGPGNASDGKLTVFAGAEEGTIDFEACFLPETTQAMADDAEFMKTVDV